MYLNEGVLDAIPVFPFNWTLTYNVFKWKEAQTKLRKEINWTLTYNVFKLFF